MKWGDLSQARADAAHARGNSDNACRLVSGRDVLWSANEARLQWALAATHVLAYLLTPPPRTLGQVAYEAYYTAIAQPLLLRSSWLGEHPVHRMRWERAAAAVLAHAREGEFAEREAWDVTLSDEGEP